MTLRLRILIATTFLVTGIVGSMLSILSGVVNQQVEESSHEISDRTTSTLVAAFGAQQRGLLESTELLAGQREVHDLLIKDSDRITLGLIELSARIEVDWMMLVNAQGLVLGASKGAPFSERSHVSGNGLFSKAKSGEVWRGVLERENDASLASSVPIFGEGGFVKGMLVTGRTINHDTLHRIAGPTHSELIVMKGNRILAATVPVTQVGTGGAEIQRFLVDGVPYVGQQHRLPNGGSLDYYAIVPESAITGPFERMRAALWSLFVTGLLVSLILGWWFAFRLTRPINDLVDSATQLKEGKWPTPFHSSRQDEIGLLQNVFDEMTESLRQNRERFISMLQLDPLTELLNYRAFRTKVEEYLQEGRHDMSVVLFDVDAFETFNQAHGAEAGDDMLRSIATMLKDRAPIPEALARYGGNEFSALVPIIDAERWSEEVRDAIAQATPLTVSVGVASVGPATLRSDLLLLAAEIANSQAKAAGRNRVRVFEAFEVADGPDALPLLAQHGSYGAVRALAEAVDAKDEYTRGHSQRVAEYARKLAHAAGHDEGFVELVYVTGTLHDVGKIGVPDEILKKTGKLTDAEFAMVKLHPELGERIVSQIPQLKETLAGIRNHHERWDGRGYPDGLAGEQIPILARILAVADTFDAMTSDRPYRPGMPIGRALDEIERGAGTQFDPEYAIRFVELFREPGQLPEAA